MFKDNKCKEQYHENNDCEISITRLFRTKKKKKMSFSRKEISYRWMEILLDKKRQKKRK